MSDVINIVHEWTADRRGRVRTVVAASDGGCAATGGGGVCSAHVRSTVFLLAARSGDVSQTIIVILDCTIITLRSPRPHRHSVLRPDGVHETVREEAQDVTERAANDAFSLAAMSPRLDNNVGRDLSKRICS